MIPFEEAEIRSKIIKAMAHPVRLMMIEFLKTGERCFSEIFDLFQLDKSTISKHLLVLKEAGIVSGRPRHPPILPPINRIGGISPEFVL